MRKVANLGMMSADKRNGLSPLLPHRIRSEGCFPAATSRNSSWFCFSLSFPKFATFRTEPEVIQPGSEADIVVTVNASLIPAEKGKSFTFPIILEGVDARPSDRILNIKVNCIK